jgi:hypothetical protein
VINYLKWALIVSWAFLAVAAPPLQAEEEEEGRGNTEYAEQEYQGVIRKVSVEDNALEVSGWYFDVPADVPVSIRGGPGALSMLAEGMQVIVLYRVVGDARVALAIDQLPDNQEMPEF